MSDKPRCSQKIYKGSWYRPYSCSRYGTIQRGGKWYCTQHDPIEVQKRQDKTDEARRKKFELELMESKFERLGPRFLDVCKDLVKWVDETNGDNKSQLLTIYEDAKELVKVMKK